MGGTGTDKFPRATRFDKFFDNEWLLVKNKSFQNLNSERRHGHARLSLVE
jgi:hypothetical protein